MVFDAVSYELYETLNRPGDSEKLLGSSGFGDILDATSTIILAIVVTIATEIAKEGVGLSKQILLKKLKDKRTKIVHPKEENRTKNGIINEIINYIEN